jgi:hypothetical protein
VTNREFSILCAASRTGIGVTVLDVFNQWYRSSKQPQKKCAGILKMLRDCGDRRWLDERGSSTSFLYSEVRFVLTRRGRDAANAEFYARSNRRRPDPPELRLVLCGGGDVGEGFC